MLNHLGLAGDRMTSTHQPSVVVTTTFPRERSLSAFCFLTDSLAACLAACLGAATQVDRSALRLESSFESEQVDSGESTQAAANGRQKLKRAAGDSGGAFDSLYHLLC